jgi:hypothetical protein
MVQDYQAGYLACPGRKDPRELARTMTKDDLALYKLQLALDPSPDEYPTRAELYRAAFNRLRSFVAIGITERLNESFMLISRQLGAANPPEFGRRNVAQNRPTAIDDHTMRIIRECTEIDHALYADELKQFEDNIEEQLEKRLETRE